MIEGHAGAPGKDEGREDPGLTNKRGSNPLVKPRWPHDRAVCFG
jgi:hypothetical protein